MYNILNNSIFSAILDYLALNGLHNIEANMMYYEMINNGTTTLSLKKFHILFNLVHNILKPTLNLDSSETDFLLQNDGILAFEINEFLNNNNNPDYEMIQQFIDMTESGEINMTLSEFEMAYNAPPWFESPDPDSLRINDIKEKLKCFETSNNNNNLLIINLQFLLSNLTQVQEMLLVLAWKFI